ncbi:patatin-like phospholipase [Chloropicon roscoffensis]|uniref:Patatin n=1 Tax=Chloropicon roscoffensis TaxID=1461544 RepID=A0AAX4PM73_9CHLO
MEPAWARPRRLGPPSGTHLDPPHRSRASLVRATPKRSPRRPSRPAHTSSRQESSSSSRSLAPRATASSSPSPSSSSSPTDERHGDRPVIALPGGGIYFYWNAGVLAYLAERYELEGCELVGASAGALSVVLVACGVDFRKATEVAYRLAEENGLYDRPLALVGIWGRLVREWLEELLPEDAHLTCESRVKVVLLEVFPLNRRAVEEFKSRDDLIEALMASAHIPFLLDYKPFSSFRGKLCIDGSALKNNYVADPDGSGRSIFRLLSKGPSAKEDLVYFKDRYSEGVIGETMGLAGEGKQQDIYLTYMKDEVLEDEFFDFMQLKTLDGVMALVDAGYEYARREEERGGFGALEGLRREA